MRLKGIYADHGTLIGIDFQSGRPVVADAVSTYDAMDEYQPLRFATPEDLQPRYAEPRSVAEHNAIPQKMSPYGLIRQFKPTPRVPVKMEFDIPPDGMSRKERRRIKRAIESGKINRIMATGNYR